jgi:hypothetical protein
MIHAMLWTIALFFWIWVGINVLCLVLGGIGEILAAVAKEYDSVMLEYAKASSGERFSGLLVMVLIVALVVYGICVKFG